MSLNGKLNSIQKNYDLLTPHERFLAVIEAHSRGDDLEIMSLVNTCPRANYTASEQPYRARLDAARRLGDLVVFDVLAKVGGGYIGITLGEKRDKEELYLHGESLMNSAAACWEGFKLFCEDIGVRNFEGFLLYNSYGLNKFGAVKAGNGISTNASIFEMFLGLLTHFEPDPADIEDARVQCHDFWQWAINPKNACV